MIDLTCSIEIAVVLVIMMVAYGARVALSGAASFDRVKRDKGSALFGARAMQMGYWALDPIGRVLAASGVSANAVSASALVLGLGAGVAIAMGHFGVAAALAGVGALCDALDGMVARHTGTASDSGEVLDATIDRYVDFAFLAGLVIHESDDPLRMALALAAILGSFMVSYATAKAEAMGIDAPRGAMRRPERALYLTLGAAFCPFGALWASRGGPRWAAEAPMIAATVLVAVVSNVSAVRRLASVARALQARRIPAPAPPSLTPEGRTVPPRGEREALPAGGEGRGEMNRGSPRGGTGLFATFGRHQIGSIIATVVDFGIMSLLVSGIGVPAASATAIGAGTGGIVNFTLGRRWIFRAGDAPAASQAWRYTFVSLVSLSLNAEGEYVLHDRLGLQYFLARVLVSIAVSVCWNFPLQRNFVYRQEGPRTAASR